MTKILDQWSHTLCAGYSVLGALQYYDASLNTDAIMQELNKTQLITQHIGSDEMKNGGKNAISDFSRSSLRI